jgi:3-methylfumaryl-CoA hydratase
MTYSAEGVSPADVEAWRGHIGRSETRRQRLDIESLRRFAAAQGASLDVEREPPPLAHWAYFLDAVAPSAIGPDGHPRRGGLLPPVSLPRRMFAAAEISFSRPLLLDAPAALTISVVDVRHRSGKTGDLVFVEVDRVIAQDGGERLSERQTIVYRGLGEKIPPIAPTDLPPHRNAQVWTPGPVDLFRFSAVTFNAHRIHYDAPYARDEEGYPGLVVHGPFTAARLYALAAARGGGPVRRFSFRANAPLFAGQPIYLAAGGEPGEVQAIRCDGAVAMTARAEFQTAAAEPPDRPHGR